MCKKDMNFSRDPEPPELSDKDALIMLVRRGDNPDASEDMPKTMFSKDFLSQFRACKCCCKLVPMDECYRGLCSDCSNSCPTYGLPYPLHPELKDNPN